MMIHQLGLHIVIRSSIGLGTSQTHKCRSVCAVGCHINSGQTVSPMGGNTFKFVVSESGDLLVVPRGVRDGGKFHEISHAVPTRGADVLAAGEGIATGNVVRINNYSGHYRPNKESLDVAEEAFRRAGFIVEK